MIGRRHDGDPHLLDIALRWGKGGNPNHLRRAAGRVVVPFILASISSAGTRIPFKAGQSLVEDDVARGVGIAPEYIEVLNRNRIIFDDEGETFGYIIGETKFQPTRHLQSPKPQILHLFGIDSDNRVVFFGQFRPLDMFLRPLHQHEAQQIRGLEITSEADRQCTGIQLVEDGSEDLQTSVVVGEAMARVEKLGGGLFQP
ncbi:hypothetical protein FRC01_012206, partial [Tulasnella sp. 417]